MICRRPGTPTSRVRSAVGLLLTLSSLLVCGTAFASSAKMWTTASGDSAFDRDVALSSSPAEKAAAAVLAQRLNFRAEDADSPSKYHRTLQYVEIQGNTTDAPVSAGNPRLYCGDLTYCINGCRSRFYKVTGGTGNEISAYTCVDANFKHRLYVWMGSSSACSNFTCTGTLATWVVVVVWLVGLCARTCAVLSRSVDSWRTASDALSCRFNRASVVWNSEAGAEYYIQVVGASPDQFGLYTLSVASDDDIAVVLDNNGEYPPSLE
jgi:hypothetical protein